jgi:hypothetical protein
MTDPCFVCKHMAFCLGHVLVLSRSLAPPPCYPRFVIIALPVSPVVLSLVSLFNPLVFCCLVAGSFCCGLWRDEPNRRQYAINTDLFRQNRENKTHDGAKQDWRAKTKTNYTRLRLDR